ncbi:glycosyltransferase [Emticicia oligotrophica]|uniref:glycosyltransferase n=1 Tax=Emticicia oligotrophica TaxID=312279 RepID=UPI00273B702B|nr:glycosyltransferase [Emticicia oligotrophica]
MLIISLLIIVGVYFLANLSLIIIWFRTPNYNSFLKENVIETSKISVIVPVRNEAENILFLLQDLEKQTYPKHKFEVIIADDDSTDDTLKIVQKFQKNSNINLLINQLPPKTNNTSPKKRAIDSSIKLANGQLITTTDGDCRVGEKWLESIANFQAQTGAYLVSCAVTFDNAAFERHSARFAQAQSSKPHSIILSIIHSIINNTQIIEFASLVGSGACAMFIQKPNMCNGANLTYLKSIFYEVNGFAGNENLASGDDEFLMHKIAAKYPDKVKFLKDQHTIVETHAHASWRSFYNQRKRWASKWKHYNNWQTTALAVFVFMANLVVPLTFVFWLFDFITTQNLFSVLSLKFSAEFIFLSLVISFLRKKSLIWLIPFVQIIYPLYVVFFGLVAQKQGEYVWKGRKLK